MLAHFWMPTFLGWRLVKRYKFSDNFSEWFPSFFFSILKEWWYCWKLLWNASKSLPFVSLTNHQGRSGQRLRFTFAFFHEGQKSRTWVWKWWTLNYPSRKGEFFGSYFKDHSVFGVGKIRLNNISKRITYAMRTDVFGCQCICMHSIVNGLHIAIVNRTFVEGLDKGGIT